MMTDESPTKFALPKTRRDLSNLDDLLVGVIAPPELSESTRTTSSSTQDNADNGPSGLAIDTPLAGRSSVPLQQPKPKSQRTVARSMLKLIIEDDLIVATKVRAVETKTTAAAIVEQALRQFFEH